MAPGVGILTPGHRLDEVLTQQRVQRTDGRLPEGVEPIIVGTE